MITLQNDTPNYNLEDHLANTKMLTFSNQMFCKQIKKKNLIIQQPKGHNLNSLNLFAHL